MASSTVAGRAYSTSRRSMARIGRTPDGDMSRRNRSVASRPVASPAMATFDAVFVGSGINSLAGAALLAREGWYVCVLERERRRRRLHPDVDRADAAGVHARGARVVASALHRLRRLRRAEGRARPARRRVRQHRPADRHRVPGRLGRVRRRARSRETSPSSTGSRRATAPPGSGSSTSSWRTPTSRSGFSRHRALVGGRPLARAQGVPAARAPRAARVRRARRSSAAATGSPRRSQSEAAHGVLAPWVLHTGLGPDQATSGFMTQVIARRAPARRDAGAGGRRRPARRRARRDRHRRRRRGAPRGRRRAILVANGRATGVRLADGELVAATRAVVASVTPTQLYGALLGGSDVPPAVDRRRGAIPLRPRRDADPPRARRAAALARARGRAPRPLPDRARDARPRRRLARRQRGRARAAPRRGDDRLRPAGRARSVACAGRQVDHLDPAPGAPGGPRQGRRGR